MAFTIQDIDDGLLDPVTLPPPIDIPKLERQGVMKGKEEAGGSPREKELKLAWS